MQLKHKLQLYIQSQTADASPPLGTILGNLGVNTVNFCKDFNTYTAELPSYITVGVELLIYSNRSYKFVIKSPPVSSVINLLIQEKVNIINNKEIKLRTIKLKQIIQLSKWMFPNMEIQKSLPIIMGIIKSFQTQIII